MLLNGGRTDEKKKSTGGKSSQSGGGKKGKREGERPTLLGLPCGGRTRDGYVREAKKKVAFRSTPVTLETGGNCNDASRKVKEAWSYQATTVGREKKGKLETGQGEVAGGGGRPCQTGTILD